jgi:hypothetical protein
MRPREFWWLYETLDEGKAKRAIPAQEKKAILDMLRGNDNGGFW